MKLQALLREPLVHFVVLGALVFVLAPSPKTEQPKLEVSPGIRAELERDLVRQKGRPPTPDELGERERAWLRDEALYQEGLRLGLDQSDPVVRDRVVSKMKGVLEGLVIVPEPTDAELSAWLAKHRDRYETPVRYDLELESGEKLERRSFDNMARTFGKEKAEQIRDSDGGAQGVRVLRREGGEPPTLEKLRQKLRRDWQNARKKELVEGKIDELFRRYQS